MSSESKRRRAFGALAAAAAVGTLAVPATGVAGVAALQDDALTTASLTDIPARVALVAKTGTKVARVDVLWSLVAPTKPVNATDPNDPAYDWSRLDLIFTSLAADNITPIVSVYSTPGWAVAGRHGRHVTAYNPDAPRTGDFADFMQALATRYSGTFTPTVTPPPPGTTTTTPVTPPVSLPRIRHYEIWNEPNLQSFFRVNGKSSLPAYTALLNAAYTRIHAANPAAVVIGGVGGPRSTDGAGSISARRWMYGLLQDKRAKLDAFSQHIYPSQPPKFRSKHYDKAFPTWQALPEIFKAMDRKKRGMKLYVTEAGYTTKKTTYRSVKVTPALQKQYLKDIFSMPLVKSPRMAAVVWFNLQDNRDWPGGLLTSSGGKKPAYAAFVGVASRPVPASLRATLKG